MKRLVVLALAACWVYSLAAAWLLSAPFTAPLARAVQAYPDPQAALLEPGGVLLLDVLDAAAAQWPKASRTWLLAALFLLGSTLPLSALLQAIHSPQLGVRPFLALSARQCWPQLLLGLCHLASALLAAAVVSSLALAALLATRWVDNEFTRDVLPLGLAVFGALLLCALQPARDLARFAHVRGAGNVLHCCWAGLRWQRAKPATLLGAWLACSCIGWALAALCLYYSQRQPALWLQLLGQQLSVLLLMSSRVVWLQHAHGVQQHLA